MNEGFTLIFRNISRLSPIWSEMTFFIILILVLLVRPQGIFGTVGRGSI